MSRFILTFWVYILFLTQTYGGELIANSGKDDEMPHARHIRIMERLEKAKLIPTVECKFVESNPPPTNPFLNLPSEVIGIILDFVMLYKDQLSFLLCSTKHKEYAKLISMTHIFCLNESDDAKHHQSFYLNLLENLKYLWLTNCHITGIKFQAKKLTGLAVRWSNIDPALLLDQHSLSYLDVRTINIPFLTPNCLSYLGIPQNSPNRMIISCESEILRKTLDMNEGLMVLKLNITAEQQTQEQKKNIYEKLTKLKSLELVDILGDQNHAQFLTSLQSLSEIILSSFETGLMEATYKDALRIIAAMSQQKHLTLKCLNDKETWKIEYDGIVHRLNFAQLQ
jgi:hypothetical protein